MSNTTSIPELFADILHSDLYLDGEWIAQGKGSFQSVRDVYTQTEIARVPLASAQQVERAITASVRGFVAMRRWSAEKRRKHLSRVRELFRERQEQFAQLIAAEAGKPIAYARGEAARCAMTLQSAIDLILHFDGEVVNVDYANGTGRNAFTRRFPIGPVAAISPFNFPLNLALHKIAPALAVGCSVVLKPSPYTPLCVLAFAALCEQAGYPAGALNIVLADIPEAEQIVTDDRLKLLSFTGSDQVGWMLKAKAGKKRVILELGGNAATIVDETTDLDAAAERLAIGSFLYAGQICISTQRIFVVESVYDALVERLVRATEALPVGDVRDPAVRVGPLIERVHLDRIAAWVREAVAGGAELLTGGKVLSEAHLLYAPTLLTRTTPEMKVQFREVFGPVAVIEPVSNFAEALSRVNDSDFGLQAGVFTNRVDRMKRALAELEVGGIIVNDVPGFRVDSMPYGGIKDSGLGREGLKYAMEDMTEPRLLVF
ncbi:MAG: aldehyde dehydrogenase family protein [Bacteroidota bacterium]